MISPTSEPTESSGSMSGESDVLQSHRDGFIFGQNTPLTSYQSSKTHSTTPDKGQMTNLEVRGENGVGAWVSFDGNFRIARTGASKPAHTSTNAMTHALAHNISGLSIRTTESKARSRLPPAFSPTPTHSVCTRNLQLRLSSLFIDSEFLLNTFGRDFCRPAAGFSPALTACKAANLSFVMVLLNVGYRLVLRQSLDAQKSLFRLGREILHENFSDFTRKLSNSDSSHFAR